MIQTDIGSVLEDQIGGFTRPIRGLYEERLPAGAPFFLCDAPLNPMVYPVEAHLQRDFVGRGCGKGWTREEARVGALAEAIERYSSIWNGTEAIELLSYEEAGLGAVRPEHCMLFGPEQIERGTAWPFGKTGSFDIVPEPLPNTTPIEWVETVPVLGGEARRVPAALVYSGFRGAGGAFACTDGSGSAAGATWEDAVFRALYENIERDAVGIWWFNRVVRPSVDIEHTGGEHARALVAWLASVGRETWVLDLTTDLGVPAFVALSEDRGAPYRRLLIGSSAHPSAVRALDSALLEMCQNLPLLRAREIPAGYMRWWEALETLKPDYLRPSPEKSPVRYGTQFETEAEQQEACLLACSEAGLEVLAVDLTRREIGVPVARVIVPGLRGIRCRTAPGRLYDVPVALGWRESPLGPHELNPLPLLA